MHVDTVNGFYNVCLGVGGVEDEVWKGIGMGCVDMGWLGRNWGCGWEVCLGRRVRVLGLQGAWGCAVGIANCVVGEKQIGHGQSLVG